MVQPGPRSEGVQMTSGEREELIRAAEKYIQETGDYGLVPVRGDDRRSLTGLRYLPELCRRMGRDITDREWEDMSIR